MKFIKLVLPTIALLLAVLTSCNKNSLDDGNNILRVSVEKIDSSSEIYVWFTNSSNEVIYEQKVVNNKSYKVDFKKIFNDERASFHFLFKANDEFELFSYLDAPARDFVRVIKLRERIRDIQLKYENYNSTYGFVSTSGTFYSGSFPSQVDMYSSNTDLYVRNENGFEFYSNLNPDAPNLIVKGNNGLSLVEKTVHSNSGKFRSVSSRAYYGSYKDQKSLFVDYNSGLGTYATLIVPESDKIDFVDFFFDFEKDGNNNSFYTLYYGDAPNEVSKLNSQINSFAFLNDNQIKFDTSGEHDFAVLGIYGDNNWNCLSKDLDMMFPKFSNIVLKDFPQIRVADFLDDKSLYISKMYIESSVNSYDDVLEIYLNKEGLFPRTKERELKRVSKSGTLGLINGKRFDNELNYIEVYLDDDYISGR